MVYSVAKLKSNIRLRIRRLLKPTMHLIIKINLILTKLNRQQPHQFSIPLMYQQHINTKNRMIRFNIKLCTCINLCNTILQICSFVDWQVLFMFFNDCLDLDVLFYTQAYSMDFQGDFVHFFWNFFYFIEGFNNISG